MTPERLRQLEADALTDPSEPALVENQRIIELVAEVVRLRAVIKGAEWNDGAHGDSCCPWCCAYSGEHHDSCEAFAPDGTVR